MSVNSKSMSKISDNASDGSFNNQFNNEMNTSGIPAPSYQYPKKKKKNQYVNMKKGPLATQHSGGQFADLKIENSKHQTFNSDFEENLGQSVQGAIGGSKNPHNSSFMHNQSLLPPIFQPAKKVKKKNSSGVLGHNAGNASQSGAPAINHPYFPNHNGGGHGSHSPIMNITMNQVTVNHFNTTKKNFPTIKKITDHSKKYVSPYSIKSMNK